MVLTTKKLLLALIVVVIAALVAVDYQKDKFSIFDPVILQDVAKRAIANNKSSKELFQQIANELAEKYPGHVSRNQECKPAYFFHCRFGQLFLIIFLLF